MSGADSAAIVVFARAPVAGAVKTRLIPRLGAEGAAQLHRDLVRHTLGEARAASLGHIALCCAGDLSHPFFQQCAAEFGVALWPQYTGDLGERMHAGLSEALRLDSRALLIGSDCPALDASVLRAAAAALAPGTDLVFVPVEDGGYALIGGSRIDSAIFDQVEWGSALVMQKTRERLTALGYTWRELPTLWDVDRPQDIDRLPASLASSLPHRLPAGL